MMDLKILDVKLAFGSRKGPLHVAEVYEGHAWHISLCNTTLSGFLEQTHFFLVHTDPEPLSVKLPDGRVFWGPQSEMKVKGTKVCTNCLRILRKRNRGN